MYAFNLTRNVKTVKPLLEVKESVHGSKLKDDLIGVTKSAERYAKGDMIVAAYLEKKIVAYLFAATTDTWVGEVEDMLRVKSNEVYFYDAFTLPPYRGKGLYPYLLCVAASYFQRQSFSCALIFSAAGNQSSIKGIQKSGFRYYGSVYYRNLFGWRSWYYRVGERHVESRFACEG